MIYAEGNNREAIKFERTFISIPGSPGTVIYGRYYFPELPQIDKGRIVGIQFNSLFGNIPGAKNNQLPVNNYSVFNPLAATGVGVNADADFAALYVTLNMVNDEDRLVIDNFPVNQLYGKYTNNWTKNKIIPFDIKAKMRKSYINWTDPSAVGTNLTWVFNFTIFYV